MSSGHLRECLTRTAFSLNREEKLSNGTNFHSHRTLVVGQLLADPMSNFAGVGQNVGQAKIRRIVDLILEENLLEIFHQVATKFVVERAEIIDRCGREKCVADDRADVFFQLHHLFFPADFLDRQNVGQLVRSRHPLFHQFASSVERLFLVDTRSITFFQLAQMIFDLRKNEEKIPTSPFEFRLTNFNISCFRARLFCITVNASFAVFNFSSFGLTVR